MRVLDNLTEQVHGKNPESSPLFRTLPKDIDFHRGDVTVQKDLEIVLRDIDIVVHLAAETGTGQSMYSIKHYSDVNIGGTSLMLEIITNQRMPIKKIVVASSRAVYGEGKYWCTQHNAVFPTCRSEEALVKGDFAVYCPKCGQGVTMLPTDEDSALQPTSVYGVTKLAQEQMILSVARAVGFPAIALRYQNVYGPGQSLCNPYTGILSVFSNRIKAKKSIDIFEDGIESRDFVYIDDVVDLTTRCIEAGRGEAGVFNVGSGVGTSVLDIALELQRVLEVSVPTVISRRYRIGDIRHNVADLSRVRRAFGFEANVKIKKGLELFGEWVKAEHLGTDRYQDSLDELVKRGLLK